MIRTGEDHPIVTLLANHPTWSFTLIGSRRYGRNRPHQNTDWDFLIDGSGKELTEDGKPTYARMYTPIGKWLEENGFELVHHGGYSLDTYVNHYRWKDKASQEELKTRQQLPHVDVLVTHYAGSFERRLRVYEACSNKLMDRLTDTTWADLFELIRKLEKTGDLRKAEELVAV